MAVKNKKSAFTLVEMLAVVAIIAILVAILIPALTKVRNMAKETQQKVQLASIEMALTAFKDDFGDYPPSSVSSGNDYCGIQKLAEALVGWDLMGFHPDSIWDSGGTEYNPPTPSEANLKERKGPYLELATANAFRLGDLYSSTSPLDGNTFVICDVFGRKQITVGSKIVKAGNPILYYKANTASKVMHPASGEPIYTFNDNDFFITNVKEPADRAKYPGLSTPVNPLSGLNFFYNNYIKDPKVTASPWPYRPDSYLLISAGVDGFYGTSDDIRNF
jgi:prepilin-type N-terminal cleavage/methylation domain-containing protein